MNERRYLPTVAELIDRLSIVLMKSIFIPEHRDEYRKEMELIKGDIGEGANLLVDADFIYAVLVLMLANRYIWENEAAMREGQYRPEALAATHSINGVRNAAKNVISKYFGERVDLKIDCLAADLPKEFGNWNVFATDSEVRATASDGGGDLAVAEREWEGSDRVAEVLRNIGKRDG